MAHGGRQPNGCAFSKYYLLKLIPNLSGGQRQRLELARALVHQPSVLVLDEATSALDTVTEKGVMDSVEVLQGSKTLLIVAHRLSTVKHCSRLYQLERGRVIAEGAPAKLLQEQKTV